MYMKIKHDMRKTLLHYILHFLLVKNFDFTNSDKFFFIYVFEYSYLTANIFMSCLHCYYQTTVRHNYVTRTISALSIKDEYLFYLFLFLKYNSKIFVVRKCVIIMKVRVYVHSYILCSGVWHLCQKSKRIILFCPKIYVFFKHIILR